MATHHVQITLTRVSRRSRPAASLPAYSGLLALVACLATGGTLLVAVRVCGLGWRLGVVFGLAAALIAALCAAALGARISQALALITQAAREMTLGRSPARLPSGPVPEIARLSSVLHALAIWIAEDGKEPPQTPLSTTREPASSAGPR